VVKATGAAEKRRFLRGDWCATAPLAQVKSLLAEAGRDTGGVTSEVEMRRFLEVSTAESDGGSAHWYWKEDKARISSHSADSVYDGVWVLYGELRDSWPPWCNR